MPKDTLILDSSYYPYKFKSFKVTFVDANGNALETTFYENNDFTKAKFKWIKTFDSNDVMDSWAIKLI